MFEITVFYTHFELKTVDTFKRNANLWSKNRRILNSKNLIVLFVVLFTHANFKMIGLVLTKKITNFVFFSLVYKLVFKAKLI